MGLLEMQSSNLYTLKKAQGYNTPNYDSNKIVIVSPETFIGNVETGKDNIQKVLAEKYQIEKEIVFVGLDNTISFQDEFINYVANGGQVDIVCTGYTASDQSCGTYQAFVDNNWLVDITQNIDGEDGKAIRGIFTDKQLKALSINNKIYGLMGYQMLAFKTQLGFNIKLCEENNIELSTFNGSLEQIGEWCDILKANNVNCDYICSVFLNGSDRAAYIGMLPHTELASYGIGVYPTENGLEAVNLYDDENMRQLVSKLSNFYVNEYIFDSQLQESTGEFFIAVYGSIYDIENPYISYIDWVDSYCGNTNGFVSGVCTLSKDYNTAFDVLSAMYCDVDLSNLLQYGYSKQEDIPQECYESVSSLISIGNNMITFPNEFYGETANKTVLINERNESAKDNPLLGFRLNLSTADFNSLYEINARAENLWNGYCADEWEDCMNEISQQLKDAGIDKAIDEVNKQLEAFQK